MPGPSCGYSPLQFLQLLILPSRGQERCPQDLDEPGLYDAILKGRDISSRVECRMRKTVCGKCSSSHPSTAISSTQQSSQRKAPFTKKAAGNRKVKWQGSDQGRQSRWLMASPWRFQSRTQMLQSCKEVSAASGECKDWSHFSWVCKSESGKRLFCNLCVKQW